MGKTGSEGFRCVLGTEEFERKNWEGAVEKECSRLSKWKWLLFQLSCRGGVFIVNNLVASALRHRQTVLPPPGDLIGELQKIIVNFFGRDTTGYDHQCSTCLYRSEDRD